MMKNLQKIDNVLLPLYSGDIDIRKWWRTKEEFKKWFKEADKSIFYKGMILVVAEDNSIWIWKEWDSENEAGLLDEGYTYPAKAIYNGINYSNKLFNFVPFTDFVFSNIFNRFVVNEIHQIDVDGTNNITLNNPGNFGVDNVEVWVNGQKLNEGIDYTVTDNTITFIRSLSIGEIVNVSYVKL